jgi:hypothetical protein
MVLTVVRVSTFIDQRNGNVKSGLGRPAETLIIGVHHVRFVCSASYNQISPLLTALIGNDSWTAGQRPLSVCERSAATSERRRPQPRRTARMARFALTANYRGHLGMLGAGAGP